MKVIAFNGSPRKDGNTARMIEAAFGPLRAAGIETETVQVGGQPVRGCIACYQCFERKDRRCAVSGDIINDCIGKMDEADAIIFGSPVYFANLTPEIKALIDRAGMVGIANDAMYRRKVGAAVAAVRRGGAIHVFDSLNHFFFISQMVVPGSSYWNIGIGREPGAVANDEEGMRTMRVLGENMAWLLGKIRG